MATFPIPTKPGCSYDDKSRGFGAVRPNGRKHAGCDLIALAGTNVLAVEDGVVINPPYPFGTGAGYVMDVQHGNRIFRYGEIKKPGLKDPNKLTAGSQVKEAQVIAQVGTTTYGSMLHLEMYSGENAGPFATNTLPYKRRSDVKDPAPYLKNCTLK